MTNNINLPPWDANRWVNCHGSARAQAQYPALPGEPSESRQNGIACHEIAKKMLLAFKGDSSAPLFDDLVGSITSNGVVITDDLFDAAREYVNDIVAYCNPRGLLPDLQIEQRVDLTHINADQYGYVDAFVYCPAENTIAIWEGKFGHRLVEVFENWQLIEYASAMFGHLGITDKPNVNFRLRVVQPFGWHTEGIIREWSIGAIQLQAYVNSLQLAAFAAQHDTPEIKTVNWCLNCTARAHCEAYKKSAYAGMDYVQRLETHSLAGHSLGLEIKQLRRIQDVIKNRLSGLEEQAMHEIRSGKSNPFLTVEQSYGRKRWKKDVPVDEVLMMGDLMGVDLRKPVELDTPAKVAKKGIDESVISAYSETPSTGWKLVEINTAKTRQIFGNN